MAVRQAKTCRWAAYLGALYAARAEHCSISDELVLAALRAPSRGGTHNLFAVERANALVCAAFATGQLATIERTMAAPPSRNGVVFVKIIGGFGNELNLMTHAALVAVALNRTVCADVKGSWTFQFLDSPALRHAVTWREGCTNLTRRQVSFDTLDTAPRDRTIAVAIGSMNHCHATAQLPGAWRRSTARRSPRWSPARATRYSVQAPTSGRGRRHTCASFAEQTSRLESTSARRTRRWPGTRDTPAVATWRSTGAGSTSVRCRCVISPRAKPLGSLLVPRTRRRVGDPRRRGGCHAEDVLVLKLQGKAARPCCAGGSPVPDARHLVVFVGSDSMINQGSWLGLAPNVTMIATKGHPTHTGRPVMNRPATNHSEREGARKALLDFFLLTETDYFVSNCAYTCFGHHCSNTFAYNIHNHRSPVGATLERFAPHYGCSPVAPALGPVLDPRPAQAREHAGDFHDHPVVMLIALFLFIYQVANVRRKCASSDQSS